MTARTLFATAFLGTLLAISAALLFFRGTTDAPDVAASDTTGKARPPAAPATVWPDYSANGLGFQTPDQPDGELIAQGYRQVSRTFAEIGPEVADPSKRFAGNNLSCQNCHIDGGTNRHALPLVGIFRIYPRVLAGAGRTVSLPERVNQCMTRSMNGRPLPDDSPEMAAFLAYLKFIGGPEPILAEPAAPPPLPHSVERGAIVYAEVCALCHKPDGLGVRVGSRGDADGYSFPPLWGSDSFNDSAGMDQFERAVGFIRHNMPRGIDPTHPQLSLQQAWDVVAYLKKQPRPRGLTR